MKKIKWRSDLLLQIYTPFFILTALLYYYGRQHVPYANLTHWLILIASLTIPFMAMGKQALSNTSPRHPVWRFWLYTATGQLFLISSYYCIWQLLTHTLPVNTPKHYPSFTHLCQSSFWQNGLFPFAYYALATVAISLLTCARKLPANLVSACHPLFHNTPDEPISITLILMQKVMMSITANLTCALLLLQIVSSLLHALGIPIHPGLNIRNLLFFTGVIWLIFQPYWLTFIRRLTKFKLPPLVVIIMHLLIILTAYAAYSLFLAYAEPWLPNIPTQVNWFSANTWPKEFAVFSFAWWLGWAPFMMGYTSAISQGYRIRFVLLSNLFIAFLITNAVIFFSHMKFPGISIPFLSAICLIFIGGVFLKTNNLPYFQNAELPNPTPPKHRSTYNLIFNLCTGSAQLMLIYLTTSVHGIAFLMFFFTIVPTMTILFALLALAFKTRLKVPLTRPSNTTP